MRGAAVKTTLQLEPSRKAALIGQVRRFGPMGVLYEVLEIVGSDGARIRVLDTGEELTYPLAKTLADPRD